ncbi:MAG: nucleotide exchange factor GrpE [Anaerolineae bacterium]
MTETANQANQPQPIVNSVAETPVSQAQLSEAQSSDNQVSQSHTSEAQTLEAQLNEAQKQLTEAQQKAQEYLDGWQRARAEFANYRKRADKEREDAFQNAAIETLKRLLPVMDDFERAVSVVPAEQLELEPIKGFSLIHRKLSSLLENAGLKVLDPKGEPFDPAFHEALGQDPSGDVPSGHITLVLQKGYVYGDRVVRPALVRVAE